MLFFFHSCVANGLREYQDLKKLRLSGQKQTVYPRQNCINVSYFIAINCARQTGRMFTRVVTICAVCIVLYVSIWYESELQPQNIKLNRKCNVWWNMKDF